MASAAGRREAPGGRAYRVLVAEDEYLTALAIEDTLRTGRFEVVAVVGTAADAVRAAERDRPDLVLMDIRLTGAADGIDAAREIYERFGVRSVFATAHSDPRTRGRAAPYRPLGWLSKPYSDQQLVRALQIACMELDRD